MAAMKRKVKTQPRKNLILLVDLWVLIWCQIISYGSGAFSILIFLASSEPNMLISCNFLSSLFMKSLNYFFTFYLMGSDYTTIMIFSQWSSSFLVWLTTFSISFYSSSSIYFNFLSIYCNFCWSAFLFLRALLFLTKSVSFSCLSL